jgi:RND family efflux transporter MFP subunit
VVLAGGITVGVVPGIRPNLSNVFGATKTEVLVTPPIKAAKLSVIVKEKGTLESAANKDVHNEVEGSTTIISIKPEGSPVKEGDVVCELDSATLRDALTTQKIATQQAEASYKQSKLTREVAEVAVVEYVEGVFKQEKSTADGDIALAKSDLERAIDRLNWSKKMFDKGYVSKAQNIADQLSMDRAKFELEKTQTSLSVLMQYTKDKTIKELRSDVEKAKADELSKEATYSLEKTKEAKLERQIKACILRAPADGIVVYANDPGRMGGQNQVQIEEGASVRERQKIFSLPDTAKMRVNAKINEAFLERVKAGLPALVRVEAAAKVEIPGHVTYVAPMADAGSFFSSDVKVYTTHVALEPSANKTQLRPGMSAQVEILVNELPDVLAVPVQAILQFKGKDFVFIKTSDGFRREEVTLGVSNDAHVEIKSGIKPGDVVAMTPTVLLTDDERREAFNSASRDAAKKEFGAAKAAPVPGAEGGAGEPKAKAKGKRAGGAGGGGGGMGGMMGSPEEREKFMSASPDEQRKILEERGIPADRIDAILERMKSGGGPGGPGGGRPGGGAGRGGFGGGPGGGGGDQ